ncbi:DUF977 family protein, partial [Salmonella enterica subsp. enterica serovar Montevideo]|nr:DUF977 family protein [Salmonella enterica subsp. enterica serovar Montevideo]
MSRNYTPAQKAEIQKRLTELVRTHGRMTFGELRKITRLTIFTARHYLENAESCGDLYQAGRSGIFPSEQAFLLWKQKREDARLSCAFPHSGSFQHYALMFMPSPCWSYTIGWLYWFSWVFSLA